MGFVAVLVAFVAGAVVSWRIFYQARDQFFVRTTWSVAAGFLTMLGALILLFGVAAMLGLSNP